MISTQSIASYIEGKLNDNELEVVFSVTGDYGKYSKLKSNVESWVTPAVCRALSGNFEPIAGVVAYSTSLAVEFFTFASAIAASKGAPRYENTKKVIEDTVQALNGTPIFIDGLLCIFQSGTVTEGTVTQQGGGYERLPLLMNFFLTVTNVVEIANNYPLKIDGNEIIYSNMTINAQKVGDSGVSIGNAVMKTRYNSTAVSLSADLYLLPSDFRDKYLNDILGKTDKTRELNTEYSIEYMGRENRMSLQNGSIVAQMGALIVVRMAFSPCGFLTYAVTFDADGGTENSSQSGERGNIIVLPNTTKTHYNFLGWYMDDVRVGGAGDSYIITGNATLTAKWKRIDSYTVNASISADHYIKSTITPITVWEGEAAQLYFDETIANSGYGLSITPKTGDYSVTVVTLPDGKTRYIWEGIIYENVNVIASEIVD